MLHFFATRFSRTSGIKKYNYFYNWDLCLDVSNKSLAVEFCRGKKDLLLYIYTLLLKCPVTVAFFFYFPTAFFISIFISAMSLSNMTQRDFDTWNQFFFTLQKKKHNICFFFCIIIMANNFNHKNLCIHQYYLRIGK